MISKSPAWYQALTLRERLDSLRALPQPLPGVSPEVDLERADRLLKRWRAQAPFDKEPLFFQRLDTDGVAEEELKYLLGETVESLRDRCPIPPAWLQQLSQAFSVKEGQERSGGKWRFAMAPPEAVNKGDRRRWLFLIEPLLNHALDRFREGVQLMIRERETVPFDPQTVEVKFIPGLSRVLVQMLAQTVILELNIARLRGQLSGDTPETRFQSFVERLREPETALAILEEYPVLARQLTLRIDCWLDYSLEFLTHLCHDWEAIQADFGGSRDLGLLAEIDDCAGDTHRRGRSVLIVTFSSGFKIVYKPRSLAADVHFQQLLEWLNERNSCPALRTLKVLDRGAYGWQEFVAAENCASKAEVERFYQRQGGYLALLYTLQATDFHLENLIAAGEHPVLIDLESLFHPGLVSAPGAGSEVLADERLDRSVLRVGLLPSQVWIDEEGEGVDLSGLGGAPGQLTPFGVLYLEEAGTDEMRVSRRRMAISGGRNRPSLNGGDVNLQEFGEAIIAGFKRTYRTLQEHRHELLAENSPLSRFADDEVRVILRPTRTYGRLLHESYHPNLLRHGLDRELYFDQLWIAAESQPELVRVIAAEHRDLQHGDVPIFITRAGALDLWDSSGQPVPGWIRESGLTRAHTLISDLGDDDLDRQVWFIRASWTSLSQEPAGPARASRPASPSIESPSPASPVNRASLLKMACRIGDRLDQLAVRGKDDATWLGLTFVNERSSPLKPLGIDLYSGLPGVILFLANLGDFAGEDRYTVLARAAFSNLQRQIEKLRPSLIRIGGFTGWGGVIYLMTRLGALWRERALFEQAEDLVDLVSGLVEKDEDYDMIAGSAGCIGALLSLYQTTGSSVSFSVAGRCGDRLIACRKPMTTGHGWCGRASGATPPPGFSHGAGGIAWALLKLAALTDVDHYRAAARGAIEYERSLFSPAHRGWPDLRGRDLRISRGQDDRASMVTWCHGAPGIGLGRLDSLSQLDDDETCAEIRTAIELTLTQGFGQNHSLCHGDLGNLDFLIQAQATLADASLRIEIERLSAVILEDLERHGVFCGVPGGVETPGLMNGLAGIGYGLLRLAEPSRLPSVLTLAAPPAE